MDVSIGDEIRIRQGIRCGLEGAIAVAEQSKEKSIVIVAIKLDEVLI